MNIIMMKVRLLLIVREPVTRLVSDFTQISHNRREKGLASRFSRMMMVVIGQDMVMMMISNPGRLL